MPEREISIVIKGKNLSAADFQAARQQIAGLKRDAEGTAPSANTMGDAFKKAAGYVGGFISAQAIMGGLSSAFSFAKGAAIDMNASLEKSTLQFGTLMGDTQRAEKHVRDLFQFAKTTPFETGPVIEASRHMQTFGGDSLNTMANLTLLGDAAAATSAPIDQLGFWVGRMYAAMKGGQPFGEATMRLMEMGVLTPQVRSQMEALSGSAGGGEKAFKLFQDSLGGFSGAMVAQAGTWDGLMSSISDAINITLADALHPFFETVKVGAGVVLQALGSEGMANVFDGLKNSLTNVFGGDGQSMVKTLGSGLLTFASIAMTIADVIVKAFSWVNSGIMVIGTGVTGVVGAVVSGIDAIVTVASKVPGIGSKFDGVKEAVHGTNLQLQAMRQSFADSAIDSYLAANGQSAFSQTVAAGKTAIEGMRAELLKAAVASDTHTTATGKNASAQGGATALTKTQITELTKARKALADWNDEIDEQNRAFLKDMATMADFTKAVEVYTERIGKSIIANAKIQRDSETERDKITRDQTMTRLQLEIDAVQRWAENEKLQLDKSVANWRAASAAIDAVAAKKVAILSEDDELKQRIIFANLETSAKNAVSGVGKAFRDMGSVIIGAIQGGGDVLGAVGASLGQGIGQDLVKKFGTTITNKLGDTLGGAINTMLPGVGALLGPLVSKVGSSLKGLFGIGINEEVKKANAEIQKVHESLLQQYGDMQQLEVAAQRVGLSFKENWGHQGQAGLKATNELVAQLKARTEAVDAAFTRTGNGFAAVVTGMTKPWTELGTLIDEAYKKTVVAEDAYKKALGDPSVTADQLRDLQAAFYEASDAEQLMYRRQWTAAQASKQQIADLGVQAVASFGAALVAGKSYSEALAIVGPSVATLGESYKALGLNVEDVGLRHLILQSTVAKGNPELIAAVSGLGSSMQGLAQLGMLNADTFGAMQRTGMSMYERLQTGVSELGGETADALLPMQDYLHEAKIQADLLGIPLDDNTQRLIDQSQQLGIWQEKGKTAQDLIIDGMKQIVDKLDTVIGRFLSMTDTINKIPTHRTVTIEAQYVDAGAPDGWGERSWDSAPGFATGTYGELGRDFPDFGDGTRAVLHNREAVVPYEDRISTAMRWLGMGSGQSMALAGGGAVNLYVSMDRSTGRARLLGEAERGQVQDWIYSGQIDIPQRAVSQRGR